MHTHKRRGLTPLDKVLLIALTLAVAVPSLAKVIAGGDSLKVLIVATLSVAAIVYILTRPSSCAGEE